MSSNRDEAYKLLDARAAKRKGIIRTSLLHLAINKLQQNKERNSK